MINIFPPLIVSDDWEVWHDCEEMPQQGVCIGSGKTRSGAILEASKTLLEAHGYLLKVLTNPRLYHVKTNFGRRGPVEQKVGSRLELSPVATTAPADNFPMTEPRRSEQDSRDAGNRLAAVARDAEAPKGLGRSGYEPLMQNREGQREPRPDRDTAANNFSGPEI